jgi:1-hydroxycarotenoid 3,4-desaturase
VSGRFDAVIVGAGLGGLAAGVSLAARGLRVRVFEAAERPGGKAGVEVVDGVEFDTGPSVLTMPDAVDGVFRRAGTSLSAEVALREPEPAFRYLWPDGTRVDVFARVERTLDSVGAALGSDARRELAGFLDYAADIWSSAAPYFVFGDAPTVTGVLKLGPRALWRVTKVDALRSMQSAIEARVRDPHLRDVLMRYATYNGSDPRRAPATLNCIAHVELALGGYGVEGGIGELVRALVRVGERHGLEIETGARVESVLVEAGRAAGVRLADGRVARAEAVVANADVAHVAGELLPPQARGVVDGRGEPSMSGFTAVLRARRRSGDAARVAHTVLFPTRPYTEEFADVFDRDRPPEEPTVYLCAQEPCHGRAGWPEHEPVFVMANAPPEPPAGRPRRDPEVWSTLRERLLGRAVRAGLLDDADRVVWERTPAALAERFPGTRGAIYGTSSNGLMAAFQRPANRVAGLPGLYLASGSAHPGGGMPLCVLSGRRAADCALEDGLATRAPRPGRRAASVA